MSMFSSSAAKHRGDLGGLGAALSQAFDKLVASQQARADAFVRPYLARLSAQELADLGFGPGEIAKIKSAAKEEPPYHI